MLSCNDIPALIEKYGNDIAFMGGIDSTVLDVSNCTDTLVEETVNSVLDACGKYSFIPCLTRGISGSIFPGVYEAVSAAIDKRSKLDF